MISSADHDLIQDYLDDVLSADARTGLEARLRAEPALADAFLRLAREEAILTEWARASHVVEATEHETVSMARPSPVRRLTRPAIAAAALIALAVAGWFGFPRPQQPEPVPETAAAHVGEVQGNVYVVSESGEPTRAQTGQPLAYGQGLRTEGGGSFAVVTFPDDSRLELGADTRIRLNPMPPAGPEPPGRGVFVEQGQVAAARNPSDQPMLLQTPHAEAWLTGKSNVASLPNETRIEPEKGKIHVKRKSDGRAIDVGPGEYAVAGPNRQFAPKRAPRVAEVRAISEPSGPVLSAAFSTDGSILATGCSDGTIKLWDVNTGTLRQVLRGHSKPVRAVAFSPVGPLLVSGNEEKVLKFWDPLTGEELAALKSGKCGIECLAFAPDGALLVSTGNGGRGGPDVLFWDVARRKEIGSLIAHKGGTGTAAFAPDGRTLATAGRDSTVKLWDLGNRQLRRTLIGHASRVNAVAFSPDGSWLASAGTDRLVRFWDTATGIEKPALTGISSDVRAVAYSPDGKTLATADRSYLTFWDVATNRERVRFKAHKQHITALRFSPDGKLLATTGSDRMIRLWDPARLVQ